MTNPTAPATSEAPAPKAAPRWDGRERRKYPRYSVKDSQSEFSQVEFLSFFKKESEGNRPLVDMVEGGLQFASERLFGKGQKVILCVIVPSMQIALKVNGTVAWHASGGAGKKCRAGVHFSRCSAEGALKLRALAQPLTRDPGLAELYVKRDLQKLGKKGK
jgi:hypothetical protein